LRFRGTLYTWKELYLDTRAGKRFGVDGWNIFWLAAYFAGVLFVAPPMLIPANLLAILLAASVAGADFAVGASLWAGAAYLAFRFPAVFAVLVVASWLGLLGISWRRRRRGFDTAGRASLT
jgi:hypothetical protein